MAARDVSAILFVDVDNDGRKDVVTVRIYLGLMFSLVRSVGGFSCGHR